MNMAMSGMFRPVELDKESQETLREMLITEEKLLIVNDFKNRELYQKILDKNSEILFLETEIRKLNSLLDNAKMELEELNTIYNNNISRQLIRNDDKVKIKK